jgi:hypothetical protein
MQRLIVHVRVQLPMTEVSGHLAPYWRVPAKPRVVASSLPQIACATLRSDLFPRKARKVAAPDTTPDLRQRAKINDASGYSSRVPDSSSFARLY